MKKFLCPTLSLLGIFLFSCKKDDNKNKSIDFGLSRHNIAVGASAGYTDTFTVQSDVAWKLSADPGSSGWLTIDKAEGAGGKTVITLKVNAANAGITRTATVSLSSPDNSYIKQMNLTVTQKVFSKVFMKSFGGTDSDVMEAVAQCSDGGYFAVGSTDSRNGDITGFHGNYDEWVVKVDANGNKVWQKIIGGTDWEDPWGVVATPDGGCVVTINTRSTDFDAVGNHGDYDALIVKLDANGNIVWKTIMGGSQEDRLNKIVAAADGGYILAGSTYSTDGDLTGLGNQGGADCWLVKVDANGKKVWSKTMGGSMDDVASSLIASPGGGYVFTANTYSTNGIATGAAGNGDILVVKIDETGNIGWSKVYGEAGYDDAEAIFPARDNGFLVTGYSKSKTGEFSGNHGKEDLWVIRLDGSGNKVWQKLYGGTLNDEGWGVTIVPDGGYMVTGLTYSNNGDVTQNAGNSDLWLLHIGEKGELLSQQTMGNQARDLGNGIITGNDGSLIIAGQNFDNGGIITDNHGLDDYWIIKLK